MELCGLGTVLRYRAIALVSLLARTIALELENPAHRRSPLVRLTGKGMRRLEAMQKREMHLLVRARFGMAAEGIERAADTLHLLRRSREQRMEEICCRKQLSSQCQCKGGRAFEALSLRHLRSAGQSSRPLRESESDVPRRHQRRHLLASRCHSRTA